MEGIFGSIPNGETTPSSQAITTIVARDRNGRTKLSGATRKLVLPSVVITGALAASIVLLPHGVPNPSPRQIAESRPPVEPQVAQVDRVPALVQTQADSTAPMSLAREHATRESAAVETRPRPRPVIHKHISTLRLVMRPVTRAPAHAQSSGRLFIGAGSPGYSYDPYDHYDPNGGYDAQYASYYREGARIERQRLEELRRREERQERQRYWEERRWQEEHRRRHRNDDDNDDEDD
jgi:hypothetical protein